MTIDEFIGIKDIIEQELKICNDLLEKEDYNTLNVISNRIMENCLISNNSLLSLYGFFLKELALIFLKFFKNIEIKAFQVAKVISRDFINLLLVNIKSEFNEELLWTKFHLFRTKIQKYNMMESENKFYTENIDYSKFLISYLIKFLKENEDILYDKKNQVLITCIIILDRVFRAHSGNLNFTLINSYFLMLNRLYEFLYVKYFKNDTLDKDNFKKELNNYLKFLYEEGIKENIDIKEFSKKFCNIIKDWRKYYLFYRTSITLEIEPQQKNIQLPEETKKVIEESLKDTIKGKL